jgi:TonB family protein
MNLGAILGIVGAVVVHILILLFGGIFFMHDEDGAAKTREVELLSEVEQAKKDEVQEKDPSDEIKEEVEEIPDAAEVVRSLEAAPVNSAPALAEASLAAIEQALNGQGAAGGDFAAVMDFRSGGVIGGKGTGAMGAEKIDEAFSLSEIDQSPRKVYHIDPSYPGELRGKRIDGSASVIFVVDAAGKVTSPRIEKSAHPAFDKPALDAVKQRNLSQVSRAARVSRVACG